MQTQSCVRNHDVKEEEKKKTHKSNHGAKKKTYWNRADFFVFFSKISFLEFGFLDIVFTYLSVLLVDFFLFRSF